MQRSRLPTGELTVMDNRTRNLITVDVLIDTGAEISFIDSALAKSLDLPVLCKKTIKLHTFGSNETNERNCDEVELQVWDQDGSPHILKLITHDVLTQSFSQWKLSREDQDFLWNINISLPKTKQVVKPLVLLGCDQLWSFVNCEKPTIPLPSGLYILPTKLGNLVSGQEHQNPSQITVVSQDGNQLEYWEHQWSMDTVQVCTISSNLWITQEEQQQWDTYWAMDAAGAEEFNLTEKQIREKLDKKVWTQFKETIEKRIDGYYVRLPWKEQYPPLPDNKALAYKRLINVWKSLKNNKEVLEQYNKTFQEQFTKGIIEKVDEGLPAQGKQIHYIPHQPVLTPQKATTKLRVVFDASAHYTGCPSLNDVLYRGPVILPLLYGILLRFRTRAIAVISDVEKAFLQVRLQEIDRDVTRCLWLRDHTSPPSTTNIQTFRFTRVTFGLKSSPFLLAGTLYYHLENYTEGKDITQEIKNNMYVDNIILTANTFKEANAIYHDSKHIFENLKMNLREFTSNDNQLMQAVEEKDKSRQQCPKVLGIYWDERRDQIRVCCDLSESSRVTKRTVTSSIAAIYDPMGWLVPLLHRSKVFLQRLWKAQYDWDTNFQHEIQKNGKKS